MKVDAGGLIDLRTAAAVATAAEAGGYDGVWSAEVSHDALLPLALAASSTTAIDLGTGILVAFARGPMTVANAVWDLQRYSNGRMHLGLGSQVKPHIERRFSMPWSRPAARMREYIAALHAIWHSWQEGMPLSFQGDFYQHTLMTPMFDPGPLECARPKVLLAAVGPAMAAVAGEKADGLIIHGFTTERYATQVTLPAFEAAVAREGRNRFDLEVKYAPIVATGEGEAMARAIAGARQQIAFYASTPAYRPLLEFHGWGDLQTELRTMTLRGQWQTMERLIDDEILNAFAVVAAPSELPQALRARCLPIADRVSLGAFDSPALVGSVIDALRAPVTAPREGAT